MGNIGVVLAGFFSIGIGFYISTLNLGGGRRGTINAKTKIGKPSFVLIAFGIILMAIGFLLP